MRRTLAFALLILGSATAITAQTNSTTRLVPYSGTAQDHAGVPLSGQVEVIFQLFEEQEGGARRSARNQRVHADDRGRYLAYLGFGAPMPKSRSAKSGLAGWRSRSRGAHCRERCWWRSPPRCARRMRQDALCRPARLLLCAEPARMGALETSAGIRGSWLPSMALASRGSSQSGRLSGVPQAVLRHQRRARRTESDVGLTDPTGGGVVDSVFTIRNFDNNTVLLYPESVAAAALRHQYGRERRMDRYRRRRRGLAPGTGQVERSTSLHRHVDAEGAESSFVGKGDSRPVQSVSAPGFATAVRRSRRSTASAHLQLWAFHARSDAGITGLLINSVGRRSDDTDDGNFSNDCRPQRDRGSESVCADSAVRAS